jgi:RNA polymerase sigma-70 factor, ECF subfamily
VGPAQIDEGMQLLERALTLDGGGPYVIRAAIADLHLRHPREWEQIALLYQRLEQITCSPVVALNPAIAVAELEGPQAALTVLDRLELDDYATTTRPAPACRDDSAETMKRALPTHAPSS